MLRRNGRRRGPSRRHDAGRTRKRYIVAASLIRGLKVAEIARQLGVSRSWASREANSPDVRNIIAQLIRDNWERDAGLVLTSFHDDRRRNAGANRAKAAIVEGRPDHYLRLKEVAIKLRLGRQGR